MKRTFKVGNKVIIVKTKGLHQQIDPKIYEGRVGVVRNVGDWTGVVSVEPFKGTFTEDQLELVKPYPETENLILEREYEKEAYGLKVFVVGIFAFVFFVLGMFFLFEDSKSMPLVNYLTGVISLSGSMFMLYIIKQTQKDKRVANSGFNQEIVEARTEDLMN